MYIFLIFVFYNSLYITFKLFEVTSILINMRGRNRVRCCRVASYVTNNCNVIFYIRLMKIFELFIFSAFNEIYIYVKLICLKQYDDDIIKEMY